MWGVGGGGTCSGWGRGRIWVSLDGPRTSTSAPSSEPPASSTPAGAPAPGGRTPQTLRTHRIKYWLCANSEAILGAEVIHHAKRPTYLLGMRGFLMIYRTVTFLCGLDHFIRLWEIAIGIFIRKTIVHFSTNLNTQLQCNVLCPKSGLCKYWPCVILFAWSKEEAEISSNMHLFKTLILCRQVWSTDPTNMLNKAETITESRQSRSADMSRRRR